MVDPRPRRAVDLLAQTSRINLLRHWIQTVDREGPPAIRPGDIVSRDGSHILMPGSDTDMALKHLMPRVPTGALVHVHDIFLPDPYPESWACRGHNGQQGVTLLLMGEAAGVLFASRYVMTRLSGFAVRNGFQGLPPSSAPASSLWPGWKGYPERGCCASGMP